MIGLSYTRLKDLECPFRFHQKYLLKVQEPTIAPLEIGAEFADVVAKYRQKVLADGSQSDLGFLRTLIEDCRSSETMKRGPEVAELLADFGRSEHVCLPAGIEWSSCEGKLTLDSSFSPMAEGAWKTDSAAFRLKTDLSYAIGDTLYILDDKTGFTFPDYLQVQIYATLVPLFLPKQLRERVTTVSVAFNRVALGKTDCKTYPVRGFADDILPRISSAIKEADSRTEWPAQTCDQCKWCSLPGCPLRAEVATTLATEVATRGVGGAMALDLSTFEVTTREDAETAVAFLAFADKITGQVKDSLRSFVEANGPVRAAGKVAKVNTSVSWECADKQAAVRGLLGMGVASGEVWAGMSLSKESVSKLLKKNMATTEDIQNFLETHGETKTSSMFKLYAS